MKTAVYLNDRGVGAAYMRLRPLNCVMLMRKNL